VQKIFLICFIGLMTNNIAHSYITDEIGSNVSTGFGSRHLPVFYEQKHEFLEEFGRWSNSTSLNTKKLEKQAIAGRAAIMHLGETVEEYDEFAGLFISAARAACRVKNNTYPKRNCLSNEVNNRASEVNNRISNTFSINNFSNYEADKEFLQSFGSISNGFLGNISLSKFLEEYSY
jgi:hypothetical protein